MKRALARWHCVQRRLKSSSGLLTEDGALLRCCDSLPRQLLQSALESFSSAIGARHPPPRSSGRYVARLDREASVARCGVCSP